MLEQILDLLKIAGVLLLLAAIWLVTIAVVFRDIQRRNLHGVEQFLWLAATALLPVVGFFIYWVARFLTRLLLQEDQAADQRRGEDPRVRMTMVKPSGNPPRQSPGPRGGRLPTLRAQDGAPQLEFRRPEPVTNTMPAMEPWPEPSDTNLAPLPHLTLVALEGPYLGSKFPLPHLPALIGRGSAAAIQLNADQGISRQHAELYADSGGKIRRVRIRDLNSTHGTFVNGQRVTDSALNPGDRVRVGMSTFLFTDV